MQALGQVEARSIRRPPRSTTTELLHTNPNLNPKPNPDPDPMSKTTPNPHPMSKHTPNPIPILALILILTLTTTLSLSLINLNPKQILLTLTLTQPQPKECYHWFYMIKVILGFADDANGGFLVDDQNTRLGVVKFGSNAYTAKGLKTCNGVAADGVTAHHAADCLKALRMLEPHDWTLNYKATGHTAVIVSLSTNPTLRLFTSLRDPKL